MPDNSAIDPDLKKSALEPLFMPWEFPKAHRTRAERDGEAPKIVQRRRPSPIPIANNLRAAVRDFRDSHYAGASDTSRELLNYWFETDHAVTGRDGVSLPFRYYFCQREAVETLIYLYEVRKVRTLSGMTAEFLGGDAERAALGIDPEEDRWAKYAFKVATGAGKTKIMSLAIVWSYFHALREPDSDMARLLRSRIATLEGDDGGASRSHSATLKRGRHTKYRPYPFTEHGAIMTARSSSSSTRCAD
jgi:type III restriction enzyme